MGMGRACAFEFRLKINIEQRWCKPEVCTSYDRRGLVIKTIAQEFEAIVLIPRQDFIISTEGNTFVQILMQHNSISESRVIND